MSSSCATLHSPISTLHALYTHVLVEACRVSCALWQNYKYNKMIKWISVLAYFMCPLAPSLRPSCARRQTIKICFISHLNLPAYVATVSAPSPPPRFPLQQLDASYHQQKTTHTHREAHKKRCEIYTGYPAGCPAVCPVANGHNNNNNNSNNEQSQQQQRNLLAKRLVAWVSLGRAGPGT